MHSILALVQLVHGCFLSHFTLRRRQVTQERGFRPELPLVPLMLPLCVCEGGDVDECFETRCSLVLLLWARRTWSIEVASDILESDSRVEGTRAPVAGLKVVSGSEICRRGRLRGCGTRGAIVRWGRWRRECHGDWNRGH